MGGVATCQCRGQPGDRTERLTPRVCIPHAQLGTRSWESMCLKELEVCKVHQSSQSNVWIEQHVKPKKINVIYECLVYTLVYFILIHKHILSQKRLSRAIL